MTIDGCKPDLTKKADAPPLPAGIGSDHESAAQTRAQQAKVVMGPVAILWDIENCPVPNDVIPETVAGNILMALRLHPAVLGAVTIFSAYGDFHFFPRRFREGFQRTGVNLIDVPNTKKDAADKAILVDMFLFVLDNPSPATILLVSGDVDFSPALHKLGQRGYNVILAIPSGQWVSSALISAGRFVWDWPSLARGEGLVPAKNFVSRLGLHSEVEDSCEEAVEEGCARSACCTLDKTLQLGGQAPGSTLVSDLAGQCGTVVNSEPGCSPQLFDSSTSYLKDSSPLSSSNYCKPTPISYEDSVTFPGFQIGCKEPGSPESISGTSYVQPGDVQGLKKQLIELLALHGGKMNFIRVPSEYARLFGRPLYLSEYGAQKLVHLLHKMRDVLRVTGEGLGRTLHLTKAGVRAIRKHKGRGYREEKTVDEDYECEDKKAGGYELNEDSDLPPRVVAQSMNSVVRDCKSKLQACSRSSPTAPENSVADAASLLVRDCNSQLQACSGSSPAVPEDSVAEVASLLESDSKLAGQGVDDGTEEVTAVAAEYAADVRLELFRLELQELLVSHACKILMSSFQQLYLQRYAKQVDFAAFGVQKLESLFEKVNDVVMVEEFEISPGKVAKVLVAKFKPSRVLSVTACT